MRIAHLFAAAPLALTLAACGQPAGTDVSEQDAGMADDNGASMDERAGETAIGDAEAQAAADGYATTAPDAAIAPPASAMPSGASTAGGTTM